MPRLALYALIVCVLAVAAAAVSFAQGSFLGVVWVLLAGLSSNMTWYYFKRNKQEKKDKQGKRDGQDGQDRAARKSVTG